MMASTRAVRSPTAVMVALVGGMALTACSPPGAAGLGSAARLRIAEAMDRGDGNAPDALTLAQLRQQATENPNNLRAQETLAQAALAAGLPAEAATALRRAIAIAGPSQPRLLALGRAEIRAGNADGALDSYRRAQAAGPTDAAVFGGLGLAYDMSGDHAQAEEAHRRAVAMAPQDWSLKGNLALSLLFAGRAAEGVRALGAAESDSAAPRRARHNLALLLAADGQEQRAARLLRVDMGPSEAEAMMRDFQSFARWAGTMRPSATRLLPTVEPVAAVAPAPAPVAVAAMPAAVPQARVSTAPLPAVGRAGATAAVPPPPSFDAAPARAAATTIASVGDGTGRMEPIISPGDPAFTGRRAATPRPQRRGRRGADATPVEPASSAPSSIVAEALPPPAPAQPAAVVAAPLAPVVPAVVPAAVTAPAAATLASVSASAPIISAREAVLPAVSRTLTPPSYGYAPSAPSVSQYQAQLVASESQAGAQRMWARISGSFPTIIEGREPVIVRFDRGDRVFWRLRVDFSDPEAAARFCGRLRAVNQACFVAAS